MNSGLGKTCRPHLCFPSWSRSCPLTFLPCHSALSPQLARYTKEGFLHLGALGTTTLLPDTRCLVDNSKSRLPQLLDCDKVKSSLYKRWNFIQVSAPWTGLAPQSRCGCCRSQGNLASPRASSTVRRRSPSPAPGAPGPRVYLRDFVDDSLQDPCSSNRLGWLCYILGGRCGGDFSEIG